MRVVSFGSYSRDTANKDSDIDLYIHYFALQK
ncbi:MAG: nucleotidyltransferase domain-containing protein [Ruminococcus sp.]